MLNSTLRSRRLVRFAATTGLAALLSANAGLPGFSGSDLSRWGAAQAQSGSVVVEDVSFALGPMTYRLPRMEVFGSNLSAADIKNLFAEDARETVRNRLARFSADRIVIPEMRGEQTINGKKSTAIYRDVTINKVAQGRIASIESSGGTIGFEDARGPTTGTFGHVESTDIDLVQTVELYTQKAGPTPPEMKTINGTFLMEDLSMVEPNGVTIKVARVSARDFKARLTKDGWGEMLRAFSDPDAMEHGTPQQKKQALLALGDLFDSFAFGSAEATGMEIHDPKNDDTTVQISRLAYTGQTGTAGSETRMEGIGIKSKDGTGRIASISVTGFSLQPMLEGLRRYAEKIPDKPVVEEKAKKNDKADKIDPDSEDEDDVDVDDGDDLPPPDPADARAMIPNFGTTRMSGLEFDMADKANPERRRRFAIKDVEVTADKPVHGIPTNIRLAFGNITFPVWVGGKDEGLRRLSEMGYSDVDISSVIALNWDEAKNQIDISELSVQGKDMGRAVMTGVMGNVSREIFNPDTAVAAVAALTTTTKSLDLSVENGGLFERVIAQIAKEEGKSPDQLRREYGSAASVGIPAALGNSPAAKTLGQAIASFIATPKNLTINVKAKNPNGLGAADMISAKTDPLSLLNKIDIQAKAD